MSFPKEKGMTLLTELKKRTKVRRLKLDINRRMIFISDIHGDLVTMKAGLDKFGFCDNDYLFIIGDIYEKGDKGTNLEIIRYVMELDRTHDNVFVMAGNCEESLRFILTPMPKRNFFYYVLKRGHSILNDMADEMGIELNENMDVPGFIEKVHTNYIDIYDYVDTLDDVIIINDSIVLVHAGLDDINNIPEYSMSVLKYDNFDTLSKGVDKLTIVGHYPTRNYRHDISCANPIFNMRKKIISIDGGNHIVKGGQINFLFLESLRTMKFNWNYVDHYPKYVMKCDVNYDEPDDFINVTYGDNEIEIVDTDLDFNLVKHVNTGITMWVHKSYVYEDNGKMYCYDASNQFLSVRKGDVISVIRKAMPYSIIKKNGYIGLIDTKYLEYDN